MKRRAILSLLFIGSLKITNRFRLYATVSRCFFYITQPVQLFAMHIHTNWLTEWDKFSNSVVAFSRTLHPTNGSVQYRKRNSLPLASANTYMFTCERLTESVIIIVIITIIVRAAAAATATNSSYRTHIIRVNERWNTYTHAAITETICM